MTRLALLADLDRCTGCYSCVVGCKEYYRLGEGVSFIRLVQVGPEGDFPDLNMYYVPLACQQCDRPSCVVSCPEKAMSRTEDGFVRVDESRCIGCGTCVEVCPYGAVLLDPSRDVAYKCELCSERREAGRLPVCVATCPGKALKVVDLDGAGSESAPALRGPDGAGGRARTSLLLLKPSAGTEPCGRFILTRAEWRDTF